MIKKIYTERGLLFGPVMHCMFTCDLSDHVNVESLKSAIYYAVNRFESLRSRIMQDTEGEAYYVIRENPCQPYIEIRDYHLSEEDFVNEQERMIFRFDKGEMVRFYIEDLADRMVLRLAVHHLAGDGDSISILVREIMKNLNEIEKGEFSFELKPIIPLKIYSKTELEEQLQLNDLLKVTMDEFNEKWKKEKKIFTYEDYEKMFYTFWDTHKTKVKYVKIEENIIKRAIQVCREHEVSLNSLMLTAATKELEDATKVGVIVNARPENYQGMGNYAGSLAIEGSYNLEKKFWENAKYIHNQIHSKLDNRINGMFPLLFMGLLDVNMQDAVVFSDVGCYQSKLVAEYSMTYGTGKKKLPLNISNMGVVHLNDENDKYKIVNMSVASPMVPALNCSLGIATVGGNMNIIMEYNDKTGNNYEKMLDSIVNVLKFITSEKSEDEMLKMAFI